MLVLLQASLHQGSKTTLIAESTKQQQVVQAHAQYVQVVAAEVECCQIVSDLPC